MKNYKNLLSFPHMLWIAIIALLLLFAFSLCFFSWQKERIQDMEERVYTLCQKRKKKESRRLQEEKIFAKIHQSDPSYIKKNITSLSFLHPEKQRLKVFLSKLESVDSWKKSASFLEPGENIAEFIPTQMQKNKNFTEKQWQQKKPIYLNEEDLKNLLLKIESPIEPGSPQIVITSFHLNKEIISEIQENVYLLSLELLTRQKAD
jgi:hypothetical protein